MNWINDSVLYHVYTLGYCGAPFNQDNDTQYRLDKLIEWIPHLKELGVNAVCLGPVFQSCTHGYDTIDYRRIDCRLGDNESFKKICRKLHENGIRVLLDAVFNHSGREFFAFQDVKEKKWDSQYKDWFCWVDFGGNSPYNDGFSYEGWEGHMELVKLNLKNPAVVGYLAESVKYWIEEWGIDGLRLDAANCIDPEFFRTLKSYVKGIKPDFWMFGEVIHGDYNRWAGENLLDGITNYECYKGLYSSHNSKNYFEIAYSLNRQFGNGGIYKNLYLYNFTDNHDVNRLASALSRPEYLQNVYTILYTMPGLPAIYYGSEFGIHGTRTGNSDRDLRPCLDLNALPEKNEKLLNHLKALGKIRHGLRALQDGDYQQVIVKNQQFVFKRTFSGQQVFIALNLAEQPENLSFNISASKAKDLLAGKVYSSDNGNLNISVSPFSGMVLLAGEELYDDVPETEEQKPLAETAPVEIAPASEPEAEALEEENIEAVSCKPRPGELYRHFKGNQYRVICLARDAGSLEEQVIYQDTSDSDKIWARALSEFISPAEKDGVKVVRFTKEN